MAYLDRAPTKLHHLPGEILDQIASFGWQTIPALRLTCKAIQEKTFHAFLGKHISTRSVWINRRSLQSLEDVANSERFGPHVRRIVIINYGWDLDAADGMWGDANDLSEDEAKEFHQFYTEHGDQTFLLQSGYVTMCLARVMMKFSKLEAVDMFHTEYHSAFEPLGRLVWPKVLGMCANSLDGFINGCWFTLCQAVISSGWQPKELSIGLDQENRLTPECITSLVQPQIMLLAPAFAQLNILNLGFEVPRHAPQKRMWNTAFTRFLKICLNVSELMLMFTDTHGTGPYYEEEEAQSSDMASWPTFPSLRSFRMYGFHCESTQLLNFLGKHRQILRTLSLTEFTLTSEDDWRVFLEGIGENFDLDELTVAMFEMRHGSVQMVETKRPLIQQAIKYRTRDGIFCPKCSAKAGITSTTSEDDADRWESGSGLSSSLESMPDEEDVMGR
jgi:hypothetical protein